MSLRGMRAIRYLGAKRVHGTAEHLGALSFDKRLRLLRRSRRRMTVHKLTDNLLWVAIFAALFAVVATELVVAVARV